MYNAEQFYQTGGESKMNIQMRKIAWVAKNHTMFLISFIVFFATLIYIGGIGVGMDIALYWK